MLVLRASSRVWEVDDRATAELMKLFYSNMLKRGMKTGEALRAAQNSIRQRPEWRSPHYWAAFTLQGEYPRAIDLVASRAIRVEPLISAIAPLSQGAHWFERLYASEPGLMKVVLNPQM